MATVTTATSTFHYEQLLLENDLVALEIFDVSTTRRPDTIAPPNHDQPAQHAARFVKLVQAHPEAFTYVAFPILESVDDFLTQVYNPIAESPADCLWAIIDKTRPKGDDNDNFAGVLSLNDTSKVDAAAEMGVIVFPAFQRSHVASNAIGLALLYLLDPPSQNGLGLRRVLWHANVNNAASRRVAERMGYTLEGILRWRRAFPPNRTCQTAAGVLEPTAALAARNGTKPEDELPGRHTAVFSIVWDEWEAKRPVVVAQMGLRK